MMMGGMRRPVLPSKPWTSLPQMPHASTRMRTSSGPGRGIGTSTISKRPYSDNNKAFIITRILSQEQKSRIFFEIESV
jgi:hypothetical protein